LKILEQYIQETPEKMYNIIFGSPELFKDVREIDLERIVITGSGTSYHAGLTVKGFIQKYAGIPVDVLYPFQMKEYIFTNPKQTLVIGISQSGTSYSTYHAMKLAKERLCRIASMAGKPDAMIDEIADDILTVECGEEGDLVPKTKGYYCTMLNLMLFTLEWAKAHKKVSKECFEKIMINLKETIQQIPEIIETSKIWIENQKENLIVTQDIRVVGTADIYGNTLEGALKMLETLRVPVSGYEFEEFIHGVYNAINEKSTIFLLDTGVESRILKMKEVLSEWTRHVHIIGVSAQDEKDFFVKSAGNSDFIVFEYLLPIQLICSSISFAKGIDISGPKDPKFHAKLQSKKLR